MAFSKDAFLDEVRSIASASKIASSSSSSNELSREVADVLDERDPLASLREGYVLPTMRDANVVDAAGEMHRLSVTHVSKLILNLYLQILIALHYTSAAIVWAP